jgi:hypothetical protein
MTEAEWLACADPTPMLTLLRGKVSDRKLRLFACACWRRFYPLSEEKKQFRQGIESAERFAEGTANENDIDKVTNNLLAGNYPRSVTMLADAWVYASRASDYVADTLGYKVIGRPLRGGVQRDLMFYLQSNVAGEKEKQSSIIRCICGNPFRPSLSLPPAVLAWNDGTIRRIAECICEHRKLPEGTLDNSRLAILADALLDAGCDDDALMQHCRGEGPHVRGCWAIDLILGKG